MKVMDDFILHPCSSTSSEPLQSPPVAQFSPIFNVFSFCQTWPKHHGYSGEKSNLFTGKKCPHFMQPAKIKSGHQSATIKFDCPFLIYRSTWTSKKIRDKSRLRKWNNFGNQTSELLHILMQLQTLPISIGQYQMPFRSFSAKIRPVEPQLNSDPLICPSRLNSSCSNKSSFSPC
ncbi:uncharacterized protein VP01_1358g3 [Puccinia sorghi]|uniref:Uncharacterized protein n=1 Tax=Puccinia sorghi TaxID=27349 RepID=A0A0L6VMG5_9BASI|nr:uncharacterized protein VP01_1358g3 [Puccinia sorghi]